MNKGKPINYEVTPGDLVRILRRVRVDPETECWIWPGAKDQKGYAQARVDGHRNPVRLARFMRHAFRHDTNTAATVNHIDICRNPKCINPDHVPPLGRPQNTVDGNHARRVKRLARLLAAAMRSLSGYLAIDNLHDDHSRRAAALLEKGTEAIRRLPKALRPKLKIKR